MLLESVIEHLLNLRRNIIFGFLSIFHHVNMNRFMIIRVEHETKSEYCKSVGICVFI